MEIRTSRITAVTVNLIYFHAYSKIHVCLEALQLMNSEAASVTTIYIRTYLLYYRLYFVVLLCIPQFCFTKSSRNSKYNISINNFNSNCNRSVANYTSKPHVLHFMQILLAWLVVLGVCILATVSSTNNRKVALYTENGKS